VIWPIYDLKNKIDCDTVKPQTYDVTKYFDFQAPRLAKSWLRPWFKLVMF